ALHLRRRARPRREGYRPGGAPDKRFRGRSIRPPRGVVAIKGKAGRSAAGRRRFRFPIVGGPVPRRSVMRRLAGLLLGAVVVLGLTVAGVGGQEKKEEKKGKEHKVQMLDNKFDPKELTIEVGDTVTWVNKGEKVHTATADEKVKDNPFDTKNVKPGE